MNVIEIKERRASINRYIKGTLSSAQILVLGFAGFILVGALLLALPQATADGQGTPWLDALFTSTSAVCVTGLVVVDTGTYFSFFGQTVILILIQVGGLGFMSFATFFAVMLGKKIMLKDRMLLQEAYNQLNLQGMVRLVRSILAISFIFEGIGALLLLVPFQKEFGLVRGMFMALFHSISAFNNAGFDLFGQYQSLTAFVSVPLVNLTMVLLIIIGGLGFSVVSEIVICHGRGLRLHCIVVLKMTGALIIIGALGFLFLEMLYASDLSLLAWPQRIMAALFHSVTARTAGFNTLDVSSFSEGTLMLLMLLMFIGASPGSTGGGVKTTTVAAIVLSIKATLEGKPAVVLQGRTLPNEVVQKAYVVVFLSFIWISLATMIVSLLEEAPFLPLLFEVTSAFGTVGLSTGLTPHLSMGGKMVVILTMFFGRLGPLTVAFALAKRKRIRPKVGYPEERIMIG